jgi:glycosyltransferase involved in cell wall biosynthesis
MIPISIVIITLNEEDNIKACLDSVCGLSDNIIVVDSGSDDRTQEICKSYPNVSLYINKFVDYSQQRNFGSSKSVYEYILNIDADERISEELRRSILELKLKPASNILYTFNRLNHYCSKSLKFGAWYPDVKRKFWNKNFANWEGIVHENLVFIEKPEIIKLKGDLLHYTYSSVNEHISQTIKYSLLGAQKDFSRGKKAGIIKLLFKPAFKFSLLYFLRFGFLDGYYGFLAARISAYGSFVRDSALRDLWKQESK